MRIHKLLRDRRVVYSGYIYYKETIEQYIWGIYEAFSLLEEK